MKRCSTCDNWNSGKGAKYCLSCSVYKHYCIKSTPRPKVTIDIVPAAIMVEFADTSDEMPCVLSAIQHLPDDLSMILTSRYVGGISHRSLAAMLKTSERQIYRKEALALSQIKKMLRNEISEFKANIAK
jgi:DNA-directed RNA polymerase specialized sigma24 family protein